MVSRHDASDGDVALARPCDPDEYLQLGGEVDMCIGDRALGGVVPCPGFDRDDQPFLIAFAKHAAFVHAAIAAQYRGDIVDMR